jgi:hypothetical protein
MLVKQQNYLSERDVRNWMRARCSGYRPVPSSD